MDVSVNSPEGNGVPQASGEEGGSLFREVPREVPAAGGSALGQGGRTRAEGPLAYGASADFWRRAGALGLDVLFLWGLISLVHALGTLLGRTPSFLGDVLLWVGYFVAATPVLGGTLGKLAVGIRVVDERGRKAPFGASLLRETAGKLTSAFFLGLGFLMAAWDDRGQALHDRMARTYVVSIASDELPSAERRFPRLS
ncbi:MAG: hypothetical protein BLITH_0894 [Brockia lithotrophica]|uniref:RDD domain-containing protein n=1 Tax=Brockia lithotrophica TaxID=933949 RepID=A0A2T5G948_9BACL|nr:RDD family protein [Brockia lithotrophica]MBT9253483.1 RDD family protein [Brockia lithotrophica]PTQ52715.1 MAG: hypothetical protein BLITH_0894 [Brockia lithotrophica]